MALLTINGVEVATPSKFDIIISTWEGENANRNANGQMVHDYICTKEKIELSWNKLTEEQMIEITGLITQKNFNVTYYSPRLGDRENVSMYAGDFKVSMRSAVQGDRKWGSITVNFIEN